MPRLGRTPSQETNRAIGSAEGAGGSTGGVIGASVGAQAAPALSNIPIIGWVAGGWATMFGQKTGANLGGDIAKAIEGC